jgi:hypothetical protein
MKKTLLTLALVGATAAAFAQGKVSLQMDLPIMFGPGPQYVLPADLAFAGQVVPNNGTTLPSHIYMVVGLYGGTSSGSLTLQGTAALNPIGGNGSPDGFFPITHLVTTLAAGVAQYFQVKIWDSAYATYEAQALAGRVGTGLDYAAQNNIFTMTPSSSISYPPINGGGGSTWVSVGNEDVNALLITSQVPEPTTFALVGLGAAGLMIFRRRK